MKHLLKYNFLKTIRDKELVFWPLFFPIVLCTLFYFAFGSSIGQNSKVDIDVAVVYEDNTVLSEGFEDFLERIDENIHSKHMSEEEAREALINEKVSGIYHVGDSNNGLLNVKLQVLGNGYTKTVLKGYLDGYKNYEGMIYQVMKTDPSKLPDLIKDLDKQIEVINSKSLGGKQLDPTIQYFYALIAFASLSGAYFGTEIIFGIQANISDIAKRNSVTPINRMKFLVSSLLVSVAIHFVNILILLSYITFVLKINLGSSIGYMILFALMGSFVGISGGMFVVSFGKGSINVKSAILTIGNLLLSFMAGLMVDGVKAFIEINYPIINRLNPATLITDAFYSIATYGSFEKLKIYLITLIIEVLFFLMVSFFNIRRKEYDSL